MQHRFTEFFQVAHFNCLTFNCLTNLNTTHEVHSRTKSTKSLAAMSLFAASLTATSVEATETAFKTAEAGKITIAAISDNSTFFRSEGHVHGFGYDLSRAFAGDLGVNLKIKHYRSQSSALKAVDRGMADFAMTTADKKTIAKAGLTPMGLSCGNQKTLSKYGLNAHVNWSFKKIADPLAQTALSFLCEKNQTRTTKKLIAFYNQNVLRDTYSKRQFAVAMKKRLPAYKASFKQHANLNKLDWQLLVAMGYQESHLKANAVSPTGVRGLMMLTNSTAKAMGVSNRVDPKQSIKGGAKYLKLMKSKFKDVPKSDRVWFALASYNMGPAAVKKIQHKLKVQGKDHKNWSNVYQYMSDNSSRNSRYVQCMHYVTRIRTYLETIKKPTQKMS